MKKIIITGATGFIGVHLIKEWMNRDAEIYAAVRPNSRNAERIPTADNVHILEINMTEYGKLPELLGSADCFYHLAWEGARAPHRDDRVMQEKNYEYAVQAFQAAKKLGCSFFLGSGSQAEYGLTNGLADENYPCNPKTEYGKQKLHAFQTLSAEASAAGMKFIWTRIFSIYGPMDYDGTMVMQCMAKMRRDEPVEMTEGTQLWDYLHVEDAARAMVLLAEKDCESGIYVVASGDYRPLKSFVEEMKSIIGSKSELRFGVIPYGIDGKVNLMPDPTKLRTAVGWKAEISFQDGIRRLLKEYE